MSPELLIDGYNLMHAAGIAKKVARPGELERWRHRLVKRVSQNLKPAERLVTIVVFDAKESPDFGGREQLVEGIQVRYPAPGHEADELLEEMIAEHRFPQRLRVVSSDHRIQRAARRRHAKFLDSDKFLDELDERQRPGRPEKPEMPPPAPVRHAPAPKSSGPRPESAPSGSQSIKPEKGDADYWLKEFGDVDIEQLGQPEPPPSAAVPLTKGSPGNKGGKGSRSKPVPPQPGDPRFAPDELDEPGPPVDPVLGDPDFWQRRIDELRRE
jgi:predicted RNA-binding protein with PIN domain